MDKPQDPIAEALTDLIFDTGFDHEKESRVYCRVCLCPNVRHDKETGKCQECDCMGEDWYAGNH